MRVRRESCTAITSSALRQAANALTLLACCPAPEYLLLAPVLRNEHLAQRVEILDAFASAERY
jgi:hypothetical protein